ncbi:hypothetical protein HanXRQr2_Chr15g0712711 [Helianthus annuus]|uniref:Uncharacterized protein n=1 Tax=Helianthus annuus TaxID=4232 RepID=A0A9K3E3J1_HELAN|nr:hypothetical protein HanXRQr2_Chr15g0712711 [Helianthus annuus]
MKENHKTQILPSPQVMPISSGYSNHRSPLVMPILKNAGICSLNSILRFFKMHLARSRVTNSFFHLLSLCLIPSQA